MTAERGIVKGSGRRGAPHHLDRIVSVRTDDGTLADVRELAEADGVDVSTWMRGAIARAVYERHQPPVVPGLRAKGWQCAHLRVESLPGTLGKTTCGHGCEMQPVYAAA